MLFHYKRSLIIASILLSLVARADSLSLNSGGFFTWMAPVATNADLPAVGNTSGSARAVLSPFNLYGWDGAAWQCLSCGGGGGGAVTSVFGRTGAVAATSGDYNSSQVTESGNLYYTNARAIAATLTGYASSPGTISAADSLLSAIQKLNGNVALKAPLASPALTGNPTAPTQTANDNSTKLSTTAYSDNAATSAAIAVIVQTINNGDTTHASSSDALFDALGLKADANNAALTGVSTINRALFPETVSPNAAILFTETGNDTGIGSNTDGRIFFESNNSEAMYLDSSGLTVNGNIAASNFPPTGSLNTFAAFDGTGALSSVPNLGFTNSTNVDAIYYGNAPTLTGDFRLLQADVGGHTDTNLTGININSTMTVDGGFFGFVVNAGGDVVGNTNLASLSANANTGGSMTVISHSNSGTIGSDYQLLNFQNQNTGSIAGNARLISIGNSAPVGNDLSMFGFTNSGPITGSYGGLSQSNSADVGGSLNMIELSNQSGHTVTGDVQMIHATSDSVITGNEYLVSLHSSATTTGDKQGINLQMQGSSPNVTGVSISVDSVTSVNQKTAFTSSGGKFNASSDIDTGVFTPSAFSSNNSLGGNLNIASGSPYSSALFGNSLGIQVGFADDYTADNTIGAGNSLGYSINGFVNQVTGTTGKTFDTLNYMFAGGSNPSGDGTIVNLTMFRAAGLLNAGGNLSVTNMRGFYVDPAFDASVATTNKWGFINASSSNNWMKGALILGGTTGLPTGAYELDVIGTSSIDGALTMNSHQINNVTDPTSAQDAATKAYVDSTVGNTRVTNTVSANFTVPSLTSDYILNADTTGGTFTATLPDATASDGWCADFKNVGTNTLSVALQGGQTVDGAASDSIDDQWSTKHYCAVGGQWYNY